MAGVSGAVAADSTIAGPLNPQLGAFWKSCLIIPPGVRWHATGAITSRHVTRSSIPPASRKTGIALVNPKPDH